MSDFGFESTAEQVTEGLDLTGKTYIVTGCNSGLGLETLRVLAQRGGHVIGTARTEGKARGAFAELGVEGTPLACELSDPASVRGCVDAVRALDRALDAIVCNAGVMALPAPEAEHGLDRQLLTNHVGHFILVTGLLDRLADAGRVVMVSSGAHHMAPDEGIDFDDLEGAKRFSPWRQYGQSKLANILFARSLAARFEGTARTANALHPGVIHTNLQRHVAEEAGAMMAKMRTKTIPQGAATQVYLATHPDLADVSGRYFSDCREKETSERGRDDELAARLWARTEEIVAALP